MQLILSEDYSHRWRHDDSLVAGSLLQDVKKNWCLDKNHLKFDNLDTLPARSRVGYDRIGGCHASVRIYGNIPNLIWCCMSECGSFRAR